MKKEFQLAFCLCAISCMAVTCKKQYHNCNLFHLQMIHHWLILSHLDYLYTPVTFSTGTNAAGIYIYAEAPDYHLVAAAGEGFTCVDDVARAALVYLRSSKFSTILPYKIKTYNLIHFILGNAISKWLFYNFLFSGNTINTNGATSINNPNWWSWRALHTLI